MKYSSVGIISEYNPFHKGHKYHLEKSIKKTGADLSISVMSGDFTQRGEPALLDKWKRAEIAVKNGINLVVELPVIYALSSGGDFAKGGVEILEALGCSWISFGSEVGELEKLSCVADFLKDNEYFLEEEIREQIKLGFSYPKARENILKKYLDKDVIYILNNSNNILAIEYLKNIKNITPITVKRQGAAYLDSDISHGMASATGIRKEIFNKGEYKTLVTEESAKLLEVYKNEFINYNNLFSLLQFKILTSSEDFLNGIYGGEEGLGSKAKKVIRKVNSYDELVDSIKSKRYTRTAICRYLARILLDIRKEYITGGQNYIRVLAADAKGRAYLKQIKKSKKLKLVIVNNINKVIFENPELESTLAKDILASDVYNLLGNKDLYEESDFVRKLKNL